MKRSILLFATTFVVTIAVAQNKHPVSFGSYNSVGIVKGKYEAAFIAQTENGIVIKNWFAGGGFGIDNYYRQTLPVYAALKKIIPVKRNGLLLYANIGGNIIAKNKTVKNFNGNTNTTGGLYADAGAGYKFKIGKRNSVFLSVGNTVKKIEEVQIGTDYLGMPTIYQELRSFSRMSFKLGYQF
ncbi:MAG: hypothetical protein ABUT20_59565 [Bacteroidota bacterium]